MSLVTIAFIILAIILTLYLVRGEEMSAPAPQADVLFQTRLRVHLSMADPVGFEPTTSGSPRRGITNAI